MEVYESIVLFSFKFFFWYLRVLKGGSDDDDVCFFWCVVAVGCGRAPGCQNSREADLVIHLFSSLSSEYVFKTHTGPLFSFINFAKDNI